LERLPWDPKRRPWGDGVSGSIQTICLASVNSYLVAAGDGFVLIDTGKPFAGALAA
jgi:hypothetical protein